MFPKNQRISRKFFSSIFRKSEKFRFGDFLFCVQKDNSAKNDSPRFSVVVPKKNAKKATQRNVIRRKMYAALSGFFRGKISENQTKEFEKKRYICFFQPKNPVLKTAKKVELDQKTFLDFFKKVYKSPRK